MYNHNKAQQKQKPCAYFLGYTVAVFMKNVFETTYETPYSIEDDRFAVKKMRWVWPTHQAPLITEQVRFIFELLRHGQDTDMVDRRRPIRPIWPRTLTINNAYPTGPPFTNMV